MYGMATYTRHYKADYSVSTYLSGARGTTPNNARLIREGGIESANLLVAKCAMGIYNVRSFVLKRAFR